jgi:hypothetical protein
MALTAYKGGWALLGIPDMTAANCCADGFDSLQRHLCAAGYTGYDSCAAAMLQAVNPSKGS